MSIYVSSDNFILIFFEKNPYPSQTNFFLLLNLCYSEHSSAVVGLAFRIFNFPDDSSWISDVYTTKAKSRTHDSRMKLELLERKKKASLTIDL